MKTHPIQKNSRNTGCHEWWAFLTDPITNFPCPPWWNATRGNSGKLGCPDALQTPRHQQCCCQHGQSTAGLTLPYLKQEPRPTPSAEKTALLCCVPLSTSWCSPGPGSPAAPCWEEGLQKQQQHSTAQSSNAPLQKMKNEHSCSSEHLKMASSKLAHPSAKSQLQIKTSAPSERGKEM